MMLDDGGYIVIGKLIPGGEAAGKKGYSKMLCVVYVCDDRNIHTRAHTYIHRGIERGKERVIYMGETYLHTHVDSTHARVNRYGHVCQVI